MGNPAVAQNDGDERIPTGLGDPRYTLADLASELGVSPDKVQNYWLWLGVPARHPEQVAYSDIDKESIAELLQLAASEELDEATLRSLVRSMGHLAERLATWQIEALIDNTMKLAGVDDATARRMVIDTYPQMVPLLFRQFEHAWWQASKLVIQRHSADLEAGGGDDDEGTDDDAPLRTAVVGFADIVGFTSHTASLPAAELVSYIQAFESRARDIVAESGGRVVKTIGDAVLFLADTLDEACEIALTLAHPQTVEPQDAAVRVGMVCGRILARFGDVFG
ncbi:MAG: adenylate/guanylate cyclase domain-containing protein, partial [Promicromonosporaceae bacterium]|nr:adenylate/guanylate cyclase domain-containing protein [Promicromonosporaceae bacterium]